MFKLKPVKNCPHTRRSVGIVNMSPELISQLAAAVYDVDEWAIVLTGEKHADGYVIDVTGYLVPPQDRSGSNVVVKDVDIDHITGCLPDGRRAVGVIHSHHKLGAFFSKTDHDTLNTRFPMSIVVAQNNRTYLGFEYLGTGKVKLPCGSVGEIEFKIQPTTGPIIAEIKRTTHNSIDLGDCNKILDQSPDQFHILNTSACGLQEPLARIANAFGSSQELLDQVKEIPRPAPIAPSVRKDHVMVQPTQQGTTGWLNSLIPDRFKSKREDERTNEGTLGYDDVYWCEVCKEYDDFWMWECGTCKERSIWCAECEVGHDAALGCPKDAPVVLTGA